MYLSSHWQYWHMQLDKASVTLYFRLSEELRALLSIQIVQVTSAHLFSSFHSLLLICFYKMESFLSFGTLMTFLI